MATITATNFVSTSIRCCANCIHCCFVGTNYGMCDIDPGAQMEYTYCCRDWQAANLYVDEIDTLEHTPIMDVNHFLHRCHQLEAMLSLDGISTGYLNCCYHPNCKMLSYAWPEDDPCVLEGVRLMPSSYDEDIPF